MRIALKLLLIGFTAAFTFTTLTAAQVPLPFSDPMADPTELDSWSLQSHQAYPGDFNGDGRWDLLVIGRNDSQTSGILLSDGDRPATIAQLWLNDPLYLDWQGDSHAVAVGRFNRDGRSDLFLLGDDDHASAFVLANRDAQFLQAHRTIADRHLGLRWTKDHSRIVSADVDGDRLDDLILQGRGDDAQHGVVRVTRRTETELLQTWGNDYLGLSWDGLDSVVHTGDFNGDQRQDLLLQSRDEVVVLLSDEAGYFNEVSDQWSSDHLNLDWSSENTELHIADMNHDRISDVVLLRRDEDAATLVLSDVQGKFTEQSQIQDLGANGLGLDVRDGLIVADVAGSRWPQVLTAPRSGPTVHRTGSNGLVEGTRTATLGADRGTSPKTNPSRSEPDVDAVGLLEGGVGVSHGVATYRIPITVPPGRAGIEPTVSLDYRHTNGNGHLGVGWGIGGTSVISRCSASPATDADYHTASLGGVKLSATDRLCLDGQYLKLTDGASYWATDAEYRTEIDSFVKVVPTTASGEVTRFTVYTPDNLILVYGKDEHEDSIGVQRAGTQFGHGTQSTTPFSWYLVEVKDRFDNEMRYVYEDHTAPVPEISGDQPVEKRLASITYTHNVGSSDHRSVLFSYDASRTDQPNYYIAGSRMSLVHRLNKVEVKVNSTLVREYLLFYENEANTATGRSRLEKVYECAYGGHDENGQAITDAKCLPPIRFEWQGSTVEMAEKNISDFYDAGTTGSFGYDKFPLDFDGDGRVDFLDIVPASPNSDISLWKNSETGLTQVPDFSPSLDFDPRLLRSSSGTLDYDDNGRIDHLLPHGAVFDIARPLSVETGNLHLYPPPNQDQLYAETGVANAVTVRWTSMGDDVHHYDLGEYENGAWTATVLGIAKTETENVQEFVPPDEGKVLSFGIRSCASSGTSDCTPWRRGPEFTVEQAGGGQNGPAPNPPQSLLTCPTPEGIGSLAIVADRGGSLSVVELSNIETSLAAFDDANGGTRFDDESFFVMDVNGDGRRDIVVRDSEHWYRYLRTDDEAGTVTPDQLFALDSGFCHPAENDRHVSIINYDNDGRQDLLVERQTRTGNDTHIDILVYRSTESGFMEMDTGVDGSFMTSSGVPNGVTYEQPWVQPLAADFNGDGLTDFVIARDTGDETSASRDFVHYYQNTGDGFVTASADTATLIPSPGTTGASQMRLGYFLAPIDWDGDGDLDLLIPDTRQKVGYGPCVPVGSIVLCQGTAVDAMVSLNDSYSWKIAEFDNGQFLAPVSCGSVPCAEMTLRAGRNVDIDSNGRFEYVAEANRQTDNQVGPEGDPYVLSVSGETPDLLKTVVVGDGQINRTVEIEYAPLQANTAADFYDYAAAASPDGKFVSIAGTMHVVSRLLIDNGVDATANETNYMYANAQYNKRGRGMVGFESITATDVESGIAGTTTFHQAFPKIGLPSSVCVFQSSGTCESDELSKVTYSWHVSSTSEPSASPILRFPASVTSETFDPISHTKLAESVRTIASANVDLYGNVGSSEVQQKDGAGNVLRTFTASSDHSAATESGWWIRQPADMEVTVSDGTTSFTRTTDYESYDASTRALTQIILEKGSAEQERITDLVFTTSGLLDSITWRHGTGVSGSYAPDPQTVDPIFGGGTQYYPTQLSQRAGGLVPSSLAISPVFGRVESITDPNNTSGTPSLKHYFDGFGRITRSEPLFQDPIKTTFAWDDALDNCPDGVTAFEIKQEQVNAPTVRLCVDVYQRIVRQVQESFSGALVYVDVAYDRQGRVNTVSEPYYMSAPVAQNGETAYQYDYVGRIDTMTAPHGVTTAYTYNDLTTVTTTTGDTSKTCNMTAGAGGTACALTRSVTRNALGQIISSTDENGQITQFEYDPNGNLHKITDPNLVVIKHHYNKLNQLVTVEDPNIGVIGNLYDALGQQFRSFQKVNYSDPSGRVIEVEHDEIGRIAKRWEGPDLGNLELVGEWVFDAPAGTPIPTAPYIDRLAAVEGHGTYDTASGTKPEYFNQTYNYRPNTGELTSVVTDITDGYGIESFTSTYDFGLGSAYNGQLRAMTYPSGPTVDFGYNPRGYLETESSDDIESPTSTTSTLRYVTEMNERGQIKAQEFGWERNPILQSFDFVPETGQTKEICVVTSGDCSSGTPLQHLTHTFDRFALPLKKTDHSQAFAQEIVERDALGRLKKLDTYDPAASTVRDVWSYTYDSVGNFQAKDIWNETTSDVDTWTYDYSAVTTNPLYQVDNVTIGSSGEVVTYNYDEWGNMEQSTSSASGSPYVRDISYSYIDKPLMITQGDTSGAHDRSDFFYGPDQQRFLQRTVPRSGEEVSSYYAGNTEKVVTRVGGAVTETVHRYYIGGYLVHAADGDGVMSSVDNCSEVANANQIDANGDGLGNICDPDFNEDDLVNAIDQGEIKLHFFTSSPEHDLNSDGIVNAGDIGILKTYFFQPPGPGATVSNRFLLRDELGSVNTVLDEDGAVLARYSYDAFG